VSDRQTGENKVKGIAPEACRLVYCECLTDR